MAAQFDQTYLHKTRGICAVGAVAVIVFDLVLIYLVPEEPAFSLPRYACVALSLCYIIATYFVEHVRQNASVYMMILVSAYTLVWSYNLYLSKFSPAIELTFFVVVVGTSATLKRRGEVRVFLGLCSVACLSALGFSQVDPAYAMVFVVAYLALVGVSYVNLATMIARQEEILRGRALLRKVVEQIPDGLWLGSQDGTSVEVANAQGQALAKDLVARIGKYRLREEGQAQAPWTFESEVMPEGSGAYWGDVWIRSLDVGDDKLYLARVSDVSERRDTQAALLHAKRLAEDALEVRSRFLANMSHEIRTPMNGVVAMTGLLLESELTEEQREFAGTIRTSGESLLTIINDLLDFSKIDAGELELERQAFSIEACVADATELLATLANDKGLELAYTIDSCVPEECVGDVSRLRQILLNLLSNAIKFTEKGEVVVRVSCADPAANNGKRSIHFLVEDTGIGIPENRLAAMFDPFTQADSSTTRMYGGTGLGLAICKQLVELMGGAISVESEEGRGSKFRFNIAVENTVENNQQPYSLSDATVLLVDDNQTNLDILEKTLARDGVNLILHSEPLAALSAVQDQTLDAAILDFHMPGMDGVELARRLRETSAHRELPMMLLSSNALAGDENLFAVRMNKPVRPSLLRSNLAALIRGTISLPKTSSLPLRDDSGEAFDALRVLVAEDNPVNQLVIKKVLQKLSITPDLVGNGQEALTLCQEKAYDLVLMDVQMPVMDGLEATKAIHRHVDAAPYIIALTANAMDGDRELCLAAGMDEYMSKPINMDELRTKIARLGNPSI